MTNLKSMLLITILLLAAVQNDTRAGEKEVARIDLQFEVSDESVAWVAIPKGRPHWLKGSGGKRGDINDVGSVGPKFSVDFQIKFGLSLWLTQAELETIAIEAASDQQYEFVSQELSSYIHQSGGNTSAIYTLFAVSEEDARKMAVAYINKLNEKDHKRLEGTKRRLEEFRNAVTEREKILIAHKEKKSKLEEKLEGSKRETGLTQSGEAAEIRKNYLVKLRYLEIEIVGYQGKIAAIERYLKNTNLPFGEEKRMMLWHEEVNLAGALPQKRRLERYIQQVNRFIELVHQSSDLSNEGLDLEKKLNSAKRGFNKLQQRLNTPLIEHEPVKVFGNKAVIHPVSAD